MKQNSTRQSQEAKLMTNQSNNKNICILSCVFGHFQLSPVSQICPDIHSCSVSYSITFPILHFLRQCPLCLFRRLCHVHTENVELVVCYNCYLRLWCATIAVQQVIMFQHGTPESQSALLGLQGALWG